MGDPARNVHRRESLIWAGRGGCSVRQIVLSRTLSPMLIADSGLNTATWALVGVTGALAIMTGALALSTHRSTRKAGEAAAAATRTAEAAEKDLLQTTQLVLVGQEQAAAAQRLAEEARIDRELAFQPFLTIESPEVSTQGQQQWSESVLIVNVGASPALDCQYHVYRKNRWASERGFSLRAGAEHRTVTLSGHGAEQEPPFPMGMFDPPAGAELQPSEVIRVAICRDVLGNSWRFLHGLTPEKVGRDEPNPPLWVRYCL